VKPVIEARGVAKSFFIPSVRRDTVREHVFGLLRPRRFEELRVLEDVTFEVRTGETLGLMGRNGSGKSTLLKILSGIFRPDRGSVVVRAPITPILELGVGWNPELDAIDNIYLLGGVMGLSLGEIRKSVDAILEFAGLERFANLELRHYSSGMAARLAYAVAFQAVREVLILDEIFAVGDAASRHRGLDRYRELRAAGRGGVVVSHEPYTIASVCQRGGLTGGGRIVLDDPADRVSEEYLRRLAGPPATAATSA